MFSRHVFYPEKEEFKSFNDYFKKIEYDINRNGMALIRPPMVS